MGGYLLLQWLQTKRGFTIFVLFVLIAAVAGLFNLASYKEKAKHNAVKNTVSQTKTTNAPTK